MLIGSRRRRRSGAGSHPHIGYIQPEYMYNILALIVGEGNESVKAIYSLYFGKEILFRGPSEISRRRKASDPARCYHSAMGASWNFENIARIVSRRLTVVDAAKGHWLRKPLRVGSTARGHLKGYVNP